MGKVDHLHNRVEPFAAQFWDLGIVLANTSDPARRPSITPPPYTKHVLIWSLLSVQFSTKTRYHPPFSYLGMLFIYGYAL